jgi:hypothetical protein
MDEGGGRSLPAAIMPRPLPLEKGSLVVQPRDPDYACKTVRVDEDRLERDVLPVGANFSRLWRKGGVCRPVKYSA